MTFVYNIYIYGADGEADLEIIIFYISVDSRRCVYVNERETTIIYKWK